MENLDLICAEYGNKIAEIQNITETLITRSLGVLQEDGMYAFFLYLASRGKTEKDAAQSISQTGFDLLKDFTLVNGKDDDIPKVIREEMTADLQKLLFAKELLERTLIYARYHIKALDKDNEEGAV